MLAVVAALGATSCVAQGATAAEYGDGTVETLAGPRFCNGVSAADPASARVHSMSVQSDGTLFFDSGRDSKGTVVRVHPDGRTEPFSSGSPRWGPTKKGRQSISPPAGRITANGKGGIFVAAGTKVLEIDSMNSLAGVIGDPLSVPGPAGDVFSGDGGPASEARFLGARTITSDDRGNLYVSDFVEGEPGITRLRFINRSAETMTFYPGTPGEIAVAAGSIMTISGTEEGSQSGDGESAVEASLEGMPPSLAVSGDRLYLGLVKAEGKRVFPSVRMINLGGNELQAHGMTVNPGQIKKVAGTGSSGFGGDGGKASAANFSDLSGIAADGAGNLYVADRGNHRVRKIDEKGIISTIAGGGEATTGNGGFNGNHRLARTARLNRPYDVKVGQAGLYIADELNNQVRIVDETGIIRAAPGSGSGATSKCLSSSTTPPSNRQPETPVRGEPLGIDVDGKGNTFFSLPSRNQIKHLTPSGRIVNVAGKADQSCRRNCKRFGGDGGMAQDAVIDSPSALVVDGNSNIFFADRGNGRIRFINRSSREVKALGVKVAPGTIMTVAGNGGDKKLKNSPKAKTKPSRALSTEIGTVSALAVDAKGNLFAAERGPEGRIIRIGTGGSIAAFAGKGAPAPMNTCCTGPTGLTFGSRGSLYISDVIQDAGSFLTYHPKIWLINTGTRPIVQHGKAIKPFDPVAIAGNGNVGFAGEGGDAVEAELLLPQGITADSRGNLYIAGGAAPGMAFTGDIRKVDSTGTISVVAGSGVYGFNGDGMRAKLTSVIPAGLAVDRCDNLLITDQGNDRIRRVNRSGDCAPVSVAESTRRPISVFALAGLFLGIAGILAVRRWLGKRKSLTKANPR